MNLGYQASYFETFCELLYLIIFFLIPTDRPTDRPTNPISGNAFDAKQKRGWPKSKSGVSNGTELLVKLCLSINELAILTI